MNRDPNHPDTTLPRVRYLTFPLRIGARGGAQCEREAHLRQCIEQVVFTGAGERVFRPEFGLGARALVFEPNNEALWEVARTRLLSALADALAGEVDPRTLRVEVGADPAAANRLLIRIAYVLAAIEKEENHVFQL
jgi:phage baseplate assembly protein W